MVLTPAILEMALRNRGVLPGVQAFLHHPFFGIFMLLFVGALMASRLPTLSLKAAHINRAYLLPVMAALLLIVAFLVVSFWMTIGIAGLLYLLTVPVSGFAFVRARARYERNEVLTSWTEKR